MVRAYGAIITVDRGSRADIPHAPTFEAAKAIARRSAEHARLCLLPASDGRYLVSNYALGFGDVELWIEGGEPDDQDPDEAG